MSFLLRPPRDRAAVDVSLLVIRIVVGTIFAAHGAIKLFGEEGLKQLVENLGRVGYLVAIGEFFGGLGILLGFLARFSAAANIVIMIGAIVMVHGKNGFFLQNGGFEYNLALIGLLVPVLLAGPGGYSIGQYLPMPKSRSTGRPILVLE